MQEGVDPLDIGPNTVPVASDKVLIKGRHGRYLVQKVLVDQVNILGVATRGNSKNMNSFESVINNLYDLNLKY